MRRRLLASTLTIVVAILVLFGVPLGIVLDHAVHADARSRLESEATRVARELTRAARDGSPRPTPQDLDQHVSSGDRVLVAYPDGEGSWFGENLSALAAMLAAGLPIRCAAIQAPGGFDTHDSQLETFDGDLRMAADSIAAFQADLEARGLADRVVTLVWSEFGRRPEENDSGTDHGAAAYISCRPYSRVPANSRIFF